MDSITDVGAASAPAALQALFVISTLGVGGSERKTVRVVSALHERGRRIGLAWLNAPDTLQAELPPAVPVWPLQRRGKFSWPAVRRLAAVLRAQRPATVVSVDLYSLLYVWLARRQSGVSSRCIALINTTTFVRKRDVLFMLIYRSILRRVDGIVFGSERQQQQWLAAYGLPKHIARVLHNGVDLDRYLVSATLRQSTRAALQIDAARVVIGSVGRLAPEKNHVALVTVLSALLKRGVDAQLLIVGEGAEQQAIERAATLAGVRERLSLAGVQRDVRPQLAAMDLFVLPSRSVETFSNATLEAMAMCLPVVLTDLGGAREMVRDGVDGFVVAVGDDAALLDAAYRLSSDADLRGRLATASRKRVEECFTFEAMVRGYDALLM
jgi:glycosyltransferase involved in cell wall biosynthesis